MSTFIFISPDFPHINVNLCEHLALAGVRVVGIGDAHAGGLDPRLTSHLHHYHQVPTLDDYDAVYRTVAFIAHKFGKPGHLESNNSYWLSQDAKLRRDFNISGIAWGASDSHSLQIIADFGLPVGDSAGPVYSWDAIISHDRKVLFEGVTAWPSISEREYAYRTVAPLPPIVVDLGRRAAEALHARLTFLHVQVAFPPGAAPRIVRVSRSAPPAFTLDMYNFAGDIDTYQIYAAEVANLDDRLSVDTEHGEPTERIAAYVSRRDGVNYRHTPQELGARWEDKIRLVDRNPGQYRQGMGDTFYIAVVTSNDEADRFTADVVERA
ncbi:hypothetical protein [Flaviflexus huanghaiensis]|uniref:hypothetical protein n=1 Tax=Flaviflexus huanghaiensis TaxID=1111473 RepID=UPI0015F82722|nr:hypothetical protein [Flaviflexus huanghaiensis]